jgi:hypothetical protein
VSSRLWVDGSGIALVERIRVSIGCVLGFILQLPMLNALIGSLAYS